MKYQDIRRSIKSYRATRAAGDAPSMGRVARMRGTGLPREARRKKKGGKSGSDREYRKKVIQTWSLIVCGLAVVSLGIVIFLWLVPKMESGENSVEKMAVKPSKTVRVVSPFASPSETDALALVKRALSIREPEKVAGFFRPGAASPQEVVNFLSGMESMDGAIENYTWLSSMDANRLSIDGVLVSFKSSEKQKSRLALLTPDATGTWKIDFAALARTVQPSWNAILETGAVLAQVRVYIAKDIYYNGAFRDDKQWVCYRMASPDTEEMLLAYCKVGSRQAAALSWMFSKEAKMTRATLEIRRVEGAESRQFEIVKVIAEDWVADKVPFDESFNEFN